MQKNKPFRKIIASITIILFCNAQISFAQQIITDGNTQTNLAVNGNVTDVTTATVQGVNAYNSFSKFDVHSGNVVNLHVPGAANNLLNMVNGPTSQINGILNAIKNGQVGGNVFFANPNGFVVGANGVVNVGSLTVLTPTQSFMDSFFDGPNNPSLVATNSLLDGTVPISANGLISIQGQVNAINDIALRAANITNQGAVSTGAVFAGSQPDFGDIVNTNGLDAPLQVVVENGEIEIVALDNFENQGVIVADGADDLNGASITISAGNDVTLNGDAVISAKGRGQNSAGGTINIYAGNNAVITDQAVIDARGGDVSGDGGFIEFSAANILEVNGGTMRASATNGTAGTMLIDPLILMLNADDFTNGANKIYTADEEIIVDFGVTISSRQIAGIDHENDASIGDSGDLTFDAPSILVNDNAKILAHADSGYAGGDVSFTATHSQSQAWLPGDPTFIENFASDVNIDINAATIKAENVDFLATAEITRTANILPGDDVASIIGNISNINLGLDLPGAKLTANSSATIDIGSGADITAASDVVIDALTESVAQLIGIGLIVDVSLAESDASATAKVNNGATISAGNNVDINATVNNTTEATNFIVTASSLQVTAVITDAHSESMAAIENGATVHANDINVKAHNNNEFLSRSQALDIAPIMASVGVGIAIGNYNSTADAHISGEARATNDINITANSINVNSDTRSGASAFSLSGALGSAGSLYGKVVNKLSRTMPAPATNPIVPSTDQTDPAALGISAAYTDAISLNAANAYIGMNGDVGADHDLNITALAEDNFQVSAIGTSADATFSIGGAVISADFTNNAHAYIDEETQADAGNMLLIQSEAIVPEQVTWGDGFDFDFDFPVFDYSDYRAASKSAFLYAKEAVFESIATVLETFIRDLEFWNPNLGVANKVGTSYVQGGAGESGGLGVAGGLNFLDIKNTSKAYIDHNALVNQRAAYRTGHQTVEVDALSRIDTVDIAGLVSIFARGFGTDGSGAGFGGSYNELNRINKAFAYIADGAEVKADDITLNSTTENWVLSMVQNGSSSGIFGVIGAFSVLDFDNTSLAYIDDEAIVHAFNDLSVSAKNLATVIDLTGGVVKGSTVGVGLAGSWLDINSTTKAFIGNKENFDSDKEGAVKADNDIVLNAQSMEKTFGFSLSGGASSKIKLPEESDDTVQGFGLGISGDAALNFITDDTQAFIKGVNVTADADQSGAGNLNIAAQNLTLALGVAGSVQVLFGVHLGIGGSFSRNVINKTTKAFIEDAIVNAVDISLRAESEDKMLSITTSVAGAAFSSAIVGAANWHKVDNDTRAGIGNKSNVDAAGDINITAKNTYIDLSIPGSVGLAGGNVAAGLSLDLGFINNSAIAYIGDSDSLAADEDKSIVDAGGDVSLDAATLTRVLSVAAAIGVGGAGGGAGTTSTQNYSLITESYIDGKAVVNSKKSVNLHSLEDSIFLIIAGSVAGGASLGIGASLANTNIFRSTRSYIGYEAVVTAHDDLTDFVDDQNDIRLTADVAELIVHYGASGSGGGGANIVGSASFLKFNNFIGAHIMPEAVVSAEGNVILDAKLDTEIGSIAEGIGIGGGAGFGAAVSAIVKDSEVLAYVGNNAQITALGNDAEEFVMTGARDTEGNLIYEGIKGLSLNAVADQDITAFTVGGVGAGGGGIAGAAVRNKLDETTKAYIGDGVKVNAPDEPDEEINPAANTDQSVNLFAANDTVLFNIAGGISGSGAGGFGAGLDRGIIFKTTESYIGESADVNANKHILLHALASEDITSLSIGFAGAGGIGIAGAAGVYRIDNTTQAYVDNFADVYADGNVILAAQDDSEIDITAGRLNVSVGAGGGASAGVTIVNKETKAFIDDDAVVQANANKGASEVNNGQYDVVFLTGALVEGEVNAPSVDFGNSGSDTNITLGERIATGQREAVQGVALSATAKHDSEILTVGESIAGGFTVSLASPVDIITSTTEAYIGERAMINTSNSNASIDQSVHVRAGQDYFRMGSAGSAAFALGSGVGPGVDVNVVKLNTKAYIGKNADVQAKKDVALSARAVEEIVSIAVGFAFGGALGIAGAISTMVVNNLTHAYIDNDAIVESDGNILIAASDETEIDVFDGGATIGLGGVGGSVAVTTVKKDTQAYIGENAVVDAHANSGSTISVVDGAASTDGNIVTQDIQGLGVQADSTEDVFVVTANGAVGLYAGVSGSVNVTTIKADTKATIKDGAQINQNNQSATVGANQSINVSAVDDLRTWGIGGAAGGGAVGVAGGVDVGTIKNTTIASIGDNTLVNAAQDLEVNALARKNVHSNARSLSAGLIGVAGGVSVYNIGTRLEDADKNNLEANGDNPDYPNAQTYAQDQVRTPRVLGLLFASSDDNVQDAGTTVQAETVQISPVNDINDVTIPDGTKAFIGDNSTVETGGDITVKAEEDIAFFADTTGAAIGFGAGGAAIVVARINGSAQAYIGNNATVNAQQGRILLDADMNQDAEGEAFAGAVGGIGVSSAVVSIWDDTSATAYVGDGTTIAEAEELKINAYTGHKVESESLGGSAGLTSVGVSVSRADIGGFTGAYIGTDAQIGQDETLDVNDVIVSSETNATAISKTTAGAVGLFFGINGSNAQSTVDPTVQSLIADSADVTASNGVQVKAMAVTSADVQSRGIAYGVTAVGRSNAEAIVNSNVQATIGDFATVTAEDDDIIVLAEAEETADVFARASAGGEGSSPGGFAKSTVASLIAASIGDSAIVDAGNNVEVVAQGVVKSKAKAEGVGAGLLTVGLSSAIAQAFPVISAKIGNLADIDAGQDIIVKARLNRNADGSGIGGTTRAEATGSGGGLIGVAGVLAQAVSNPIVQTSIGDPTTLDAENDIDLTASGYNDVYADASGTSAGFVSSGSSQSDIDATLRVETLIDADTVINANRDVNIGATASTNARANVVGGSGQTFSDAFGILISDGISSIFDGTGLPAILGRGGALAGSSINNTAKVQVGPNVQIQADRELNVMADADVMVDSDAFMESEGVIRASAVAASDVLVDSDAIVRLDDGVSMKAEDVLLSALNEMAINSFADALANADLISAYSSAISRVDISSAGDPSVAEVSLGNDVKITGLNSITINALNRQKSGNIVTKSRARVQGSLTGTATTLVDGSNDADSKFESGQEMELATGDLMIHVESTYLIDEIPISDADTVVSTFVEQTTIIKKKVITWLPWPLDAIVEFVDVIITELVEVFDYSDANAIAQGDGVITNDAVSLQGDIFNLAAQNRLLLIDADGSINPASNILAQIDEGNNRIIVSDIFNNAASNLNIMVPNGEVLGDAMINISNILEEVKIINNSTLDLFINQVDMVSSGNTTPDAGDVNYEQQNLFQYDIQATGELATSDFIVENNAMSNVIFNNPIANFLADFVVSNQGGDILFNNPDVYFEGNNFYVSAQGGNLGSSAVPLDLRIVHALLDPEGNPNTVDSVFEATAMGSVFMDATTRTSTFAAFDPSQQVQGVLFNDITTTSGDVQLNILQGEVLDNELNPFSAFGVYSLNNIFGGNNVNVDIADGDAHVGLIGALGTTSINASGSIIDFANTITGLNVVLNAANGSLGSAANPLDINSSVGGPGVLTATAADEIYIKEIDGDLNVDVVTSNTSDVSLETVNGDITLGVINAAAGKTTLNAFGSITDRLNTGASNINTLDIDLTAQNGSVGEAGNAVDTDLDDQSVTGLVVTAAQDVVVTETDGAMDAVAVNAANGDIALTAAGDLLVGVISAPNGDVDLTALGSIDDAANTVSANNINLSAQTGHIGTAANPLDLDSAVTVAGEVKAQASDDIHITETDGNLTIDTVTSQSGDVHVTVPNGGLNLGTINATSGDVNLNPAGSIINVLPTPAVNINAINIFMNPLLILGSIGTELNPINVDSSNALAGVVTALADGGIYLNEVSGDLNVNTIQSLSSDVQLIADGSILDANNDVLANVIADSISLEAINGHIGTDQNGFDVDTGSVISSLMTAAAQEDIHLFETLGDVYASSFVSTAGGASLTTLIGDIHVGEINAFNGDVTLDANGNIVDIANTINANNITLLAQGGIGTDLNPVDINSSYTNAGAVSATAQNDIFITETVGDLNVDTIQSTSSDVQLIADGSILDANNDTLANVSGDSINLHAQNGHIGTEQNGFDLDTGSLVSSLLTALAQEDIHLFETLGDVYASSFVSTAGGASLTTLIGDIHVGTINAFNGNVTLTANGDIDDDGNTINANDITLLAQGGIGSAANPLDINSSYSSAGAVNASAQNNIFLNETTGDLNVDFIASATGDVTTVADDSIKDANNDGAANVTGVNLAVTSANGSIGAEANRFEVDASGKTDLWAAQDIYLAEVNGDLLSDDIHSTLGRVDLLVSDGNASLGQVASTQLVKVDVNGNSLLANQIDAANVEATVQIEGGSVVINTANVSDSVKVNADVINLNEVNHTVSDRSIHFDLSGNDGWLANNIDLEVSSSMTVYLDNYLTNFGDVLAHTDELQILNAIVGDNVDFTNNNLSANVSTKDKGLAAFYMMLEDYGKIETNAHPFYFVSKDKL